MTTITIYSADGTALYTSAIPKGSTLKRELMKEDYITLKLSLAEPIDFPLGCYCDTDFGRYTVVTETKPSPNANTGGYDYELRLDADYYKWQNKLFKYRPKNGGQEASWSLTARIQVFMPVFLSNLEALGYDKNYKGETYQVAIDNDYVIDEAKALTFSNSNLIDALSAIAEEFDCDWWVDGNVIHMGKCETGSEAIDIESGVDTSGMDASDSSGTYATRLYVFGGTTNVPLRYRKKLEFSSTTTTDVISTVWDNKTVSKTTDVTRPFALNMFIGLKKENFGPFELGTDYFGAIISYGQTFTWKKYGASLKEKLVTSASSELTNITHFLTTGQYSTDTSKTYVMIDTEASSKAFGFKAPTIKATVDVLIQYMYYESNEIKFGFITEKKSDYTFLAFNKYDIHGKEDWTGKEYVPLPELPEFYLKENQHVVCRISLTISSVTEVPADDIDCDNIHQDDTYYSGFRFIASLVQFYRPDDEMSYGAYKQPGIITYIRHYAETAVTFKSGDLAGQTFPALVMDNEGSIYIDTRDAIKVGTKFQVSPIISAKVPIGYFTNDESEETTVTAITDQRLMLPLSWNNGHNWIDAEENLSQEQIVESVVTFDDIYPTLESTVTDDPVTYRKEIKDDNDKGTGQYETFYIIRDKDLAFENDYRKDGDLTVLFYTGKLAGMRFTVNFYKAGDAIKGVVLADGKVGSLTIANDSFEIVASEDYGRKLPDTVLYPAKGDTFSLGGYDASYFEQLNLVGKAEEKLLEKGQEYMNKCKRDDKTYTATLFWWRAKELSLGLGQKVTLKDPSLFPTEGRESRVIGYEIPLDITHDSPKYTFGENSTYSRLGELESKIDSLAFRGTTYIGSGSSAKGNAVDVLTSNDLSTPTDYNVNSALRADNRYLNKKSDDTALGNITFKGAVSMEEGMTVSESGTYGFDKNGDVNASTVNATNVRAVQAFLSLLQSPDYNSTEQTGYGFYKTASGKYGLNITDLMIWGKAIFTNLEIRNLYAVGGNVVLSPTSSKIFSVVEQTETVTDSITGEETTSITGWKCYLLADDGTMATTNLWQVGDQARCQTFNIDEGAYENVSNKNYWRYVSAVSSDDERESLYDENGNVLYDGKKFAWIVLSNSNYMEDSDVPAADDTIVCMGNQLEDQTDRQNLIMLETTGADSPKIALYRKVHSFSLKDTVVFKISYDGVEMTAGYYKFLTPDGDKIYSENYRGDWESTSIYYYYDKVTHRGTEWLCLADEKTGTTTEPSPTNDLWRPMTAVLYEKLSIELNGQETLDWGESITATCEVTLGDETVDTSTGWEWSVERDSGNATEDAAWNAGSKATNFKGAITLSFTSECNDLGEEYTGVYGTVFTFKAWRTGDKGNAVSNTLSI